jgi:hypothetical protein
MVCTMECPKRKSLLEHCCAARGSGTCGPHKARVTPRSIGHDRKLHDGWSGEDGSFESEPGVVDLRLDKNFAVDIFPALYADRC